MATTISTINEALVDSKVTEALRFVLPALNAFSMRAERSRSDGSGFIQNDVLYVPVATDPTPQSKTAGTMVTFGGTLAGTAVTLSNFYGASWGCTEGTMSAGLFGAFWADKAAGAIYSLAKQVVDAAMALVLKADYGDGDADKLVCAEADFGQNDLASLWKKSEVKIKQRQRTLFLNAGHASALMGGTGLALVYAAAGGGNFIATGVLPQMIGMNTWAYGALPDNGENLCGFVVGKAAIGVAVAPPDPLAAAGQGNIVERRIITDPESGISALYTMTADGGGSIAGECALLYGVKKIQNSIVRVVSA